MSLRFMVESHYAQVRADAEFWRPHVSEIAKRHGLSMGSTYEPTYGNATNAVFFVGDAIVKIYTPYFHGREAKGMEPAVLQNLALDPTIPVPKLRVSSELFAGSSDWNWPYIVMSRVPGRVLETDWADLSTDTRQRLLSELGAIVSKVHKVAPSAELGEIFRKVWPQGFAGFLQRQLEALQLSPELSVLPIADEIRAMQIGSVGPAWPVVLHGDLEPSHVFWDGEHVTAVIDFGDAKLGDPLYDFVALRLGMSDKRDELAAFSRGYGTASFSLQDGRLRLLQYAILHEWTTISDLSKWCARSGARTLNDLSVWLFP